jgi:hypothetical protein
LRQQFAYKDKNYKLLQFVKNPENEKGEQGFFLKKRQTSLFYLGVKEKDNKR